MTGAVVRRFDAWRAGAAAALVWLALSAPLAAAEPSFPPLTGRVVDRAELLSPAAEQRLAAQLEAHETATGNQVVVVTLDSLQGYDIADYGYRLGRAWGIGRAGEDDGLLLIVAPNEREVRIEVGYGLEGAMTDAASHLIIQNRILPQFRQGDFEAGIEAGVAAILSVLEGGDVPAPERGTDSREIGSSKGAVVPIILFFAFVVIGNLMRHYGRDRRGRRHGWYYGPVLGGRRRGGFRGGGFSGGGGSFGGGGASGSW